MDVQRKMHIRHPHDATIDVVALDGRIDLLVPLLAIGALEIADLHEPHRRGRRSLDPSGVRALEERVDARGIDATRRGCLRATRRARRRRAARVSVIWSARRQHQRYEDQSLHASNIGCGEQVAPPMTPVPAGR
jgi:hypothetical protein